MGYCALNKNNCGILACSSSIFINNIELQTTTCISSQTISRSTHRPPRKRGGRPRATVTGRRAVDRGHMHDHAMARRKIKRVANEFSFKKGY